MTPGRFRECLDIIGWSQRGAADRLDCDDRLVRRWASGDGTIPVDVAAWLEDLTGAHLARPVPQSWRRREKPAQKAA